MSLAVQTAVYGAPPPGLVEVAPGALQVSPLRPGSTPLERCAGLDRAVVYAPPGTLERRRQLALALLALRVDGALSVLAPKDKGGARLRQELEGFGCVVGETARRHHRLCACVRPQVLTGVSQALADGELRFVDALRLWSQPGVFSWDRIDPGTALLARSLPPLVGRGADFGCGIGHLSRAALASPQVRALSLVELDGRAVESARRNLDDPRATLHWADLTAPDPSDAELDGLDFVVTNPPFHDGGTEDRALGQAFIRRAARALRKGGALWLVANRHLPYEAALAELFAEVTLRADHGGYKVFEARR